MLQIRLLGQFDIRLDKKRITIPSRAGQSLFAYLALTAGTSHRREKLAGTFWPDTTDENARKNLRQELWRIRKALSTSQSGGPDHLLADEFTIAFNRSCDYWLDVAQLERSASDLESLTSNVSLYQGELLPGFYEDWVVLERERIQSVFDARMGQLLELLIASERWTAVHEQAERWLARGNTPEPAFRALMLAYGTRGDMAKVSSIYQRCIAELDEHFGIEPSVETRALYDGLLKGARVPARSTPAQQPGTLTFLFTDIEGSASHFDSLGKNYASVLEKRNEIIRSAITTWNGREVATHGDSFFITFGRALDAVQCAAEIQRALQRHRWMDNKPPRVSMGLHTGEPLVTSTGYIGVDVQRASRIGSVANGGQVLLSQTTRELVMHELPPNLTLRDLGEHRLKDLKFPTSIYQLVIEGMPSEFPPLRTQYRPGEAPTPGEPPFKGLQFFDEQDASLFFGRELLTARLVDRLRSTQFLSVIVGASGSGKSSLVRAGLVPALRRGAPLSDGTTPPDGSTNWQIYVITPTAHPLEALAAELTRNSESVTAAATLLDDLTQEPRSLALFLSRQHPEDFTLLVVDQFEELFTLCRDEFEREAFIDNLLTAMDPNAGCMSLVVTLRADFYAYLSQYPELRDLVAKHQEYIGPMTPEELRRAIEEPARRGHWEFEPGLVDLILRDVGDEPGALPLLSHALLETWKRRAGHTLTLKGYADAGGVHGAISYSAESVYQNLSAEEQGIARDIFLRLTELGEGTEDTRRRASLAELMSTEADAEPVRAVLNQLADARLVTLAEETAEVAHEALIREWPTLREWLNQDREGLRLHRDLTEAAHEWELLERDPGALYRGARLAQAREWATSYPRELNEAEQAFLHASVDHEQHEEYEREERQRRELEAAQKLAETERARAEEQARSANRLRMRNRVITIIGIMAIILTILAGRFGLQSSENARLAQAAEAQAEQQRDTAMNAQATAQSEQQRAENEKRLAISRELAIAAVNNLSVDPELSTLLALQAVSQNNTLEAQNALHRAIQALRVQLTVHHGNVIEDVVYSPDGKHFATAVNARFSDGSVKIWDAATGREILNLDTGPSAAVAFSPDGTRLATADYEAQTATVWDVSTGKKLPTLVGHTDAINHVAFSPDGGLLATASNDQTAKVWDTATGQELITLSGHTDIVTSVSFSPDGTRLVTGSWDRTLKVWNITTGREELTISGFTDPAEGVFSPEGTRLAITSGDEAQIWDFFEEEKLLTLTGHANVIDGINFSEDGSRLATASYDGTARVWDAVTGAELLRLAGHAGSLFSVAFSPDGLHLVTGSDDGTARIWDISPTGSREWLTIAQHAGEVRRVVYSPDGTRVATASYDGTAKVFDAINGAELLTLSGHTARVYAVAFSLDGTRLATASEDNTAKMWDAETGKELLTLAGHGEGNVGGSYPGIQSVAFSPDGKKLATAGAEGNAILWDAITGTQLRTISNHGIGITNLAFSPDGQQLILTTDQSAAAGAGDNATTQLWDLATGQRVFTKTQAVRIWGLALSPDGQRFATAGFGGIVKIRDLATGEELLDLSGHTTTVPGVDFSPDDRYIATASVEGTAKVWDAETGEELLTLTGHTDWVTSVSFSPDGTRLATASHDGTVRIYLLKIEELVELARSRVTRSLTGEECQRYLHMDTCPSAR
ncbi:MAG TPA: BTAD domain-containing putative transcriptional regulator [Anaerolineales bacterium]|nr:BTAD domain-containing putative transcriptional regulator [Anaerolineales bacterium]